MLGLRQLGTRPSRMTPELQAPKQPETGVKGFLPAGAGPAGATVLEEAPAVRRGPDRKAWPVGAVGRAALQRWGPSHQTQRGF